MPGTIKLRPASRLAVLALAMVAALATTPAPASADAEKGAAWRMNHERWKRKIHTMKISAELSEKARQHSCQMAATQTLRHTPDRGQNIRGWGIYGENVGTHWDMYQMHLAWMDSPNHRNNILDWRFDYMGVGVCVDTWGQYWATVMFVGKSA